MDCVAAARLLIGACFNHAFMKMLLGDGPEDDAFVEQMIGGLRLGHRPDPAADDAAPDPAG